MDSRIREIEQWIAEAKEDLGNCGREAYLRKLYLLDAEIRAVIKESGMLHGPESPLGRNERVRRSAAPLRGFGGLGSPVAAAAAFGVLFLTATTVYFAGAPAARSGEFLAFMRRNANNNATSSTRMEPEILASTRLSSTTPPVGFIPTTDLPGEEILPAGWTPVPVDTPFDGSQGQSTVYQGTTLLADAGPLGGAASARAGGRQLQPALAAGGDAGRPRVIPASNVAVDVEMLASVPVDLPAQSRGAQPADAASDLPGRTSPSGASGGAGFSDLMISRVVSQSPEGVMFERPLEVSRTKEVMDETSKKPAGAQDNEVLVDRADSAGSGAESATQDADGASDSDDAEAPR